MRKTKYCQNIGAKHLREKDSPSIHYCITCYQEIKDRLATIQNQGGAIAGLRAARALSDGSFGYERTASDKERNLRAFFYYVMPHIPNAKADKYVKDIVAQGGKNDFCTNDGIKTVHTFNKQ